MLQKKQLLQLVKWRCVRFADFLNNSTAMEKQLHSKLLKSRIRVLIFPEKPYTVNGGVMEFDYKWKYWEASRG